MWVPKGIARKVTFIIMMLIGLGQSANASIIYQYTGESFTTSYFEGPIENSQHLPSGLTNLNITLHLDEMLPANLSFSDGIIIDEGYFFDGLTERHVSAFGRFETDNSGNILRWDVWDLLFDFSGLSPGESYGMRTNSDFYDITTYCYASPCSINPSDNNVAWATTDWYFTSNRTNPSMWVVNSVSEPEVWSLFLIALFLINRTRNREPSK